MASWTDGAAYAPIERPDGFATPEVDPLPHAEPYRSPTSGPAPAPADFAATAPALPLEQLGAPTTVRRNPTMPFEVSSALLTAHTGQPAGDPRYPIVLSGAHAGVDLPPPDPAQRLAPPDQGIAEPWGPPVQPHLTDQQRTLVWITVAIFAMAILVPMGACYLYSVAGILLLRTTPVGRQLGWGAIVIGVLVWLAGAIGTFEAIADIVRWISGAFAVGALSWVLNRNR